MTGADPRHRDLVRRDRRRARHRATATSSRRSSPRRPSCTPATAASCPESPRGGTSSWSRPSSARRSTTAGVALDDVDRIAVTQGPGLVGALLVGLSAAKAIAWARGLPLVPSTTCTGTSRRCTSADGPVEPPFVCLLASGGHTLLLAVREPRDVRAASARRSTTRPARRSTRARGCSASAIRVVRRSTGWRARGDAERVRVPGGARAGARLLVLGAQDGAALRRPRPRRGRARAAPGRPGRVLPARHRARARRARRAAAEQTGSSASRSSGVSRRTPSCARRCPTRPSRRSRSAPTTPR